MPKIRRAYKQLNSMAFVANARPEQSDTHACSLNKGIGCKSRTRKESIAGLQSVQLRLQARGRVPKVAVILKYCFPCGESPRAVKTGHWKGCHGSERRLKQCVCVKERSLYAWIDQSEDLQTPKRRIDSIVAAFHICGPFNSASEPRETRHKGDGYDNHRFFDT